MPDWFADESFWIDLYSFTFSPQRFAATAAEVDALLALVAPPGQAVLDLCCGPGRHAVELAQRGLAVTAVDSSEFLLQKARQAARQHRVEVEYVAADMREFVRPAGFHLALSMYTSFGYFADKDDDCRVLRQVRDSLMPEGIFVIDLMGKEVLAQGFEATGLTRDADGRILVQQRQVYDDWTRIRNHWLLIDGQEVKHYHFEHTIYSGQELKDRLLQAGFARVRLFGDFDGSPYGLDAERLVAVAFR